MDRYTQLEEKSSTGLVSIREDDLDKGFHTESYGANYEEDRLISLREIVSVIWIRKWLIFTIVMISTIVTIVAVLLMKPWYSSSTVIEIGKQNSMVLKSGEMRLNDDADPYYIVTVNTNKLALESPELFAEVIEDLKLDQNKTVQNGLPKLDLVLRKTDIGNRLKKNANQRELERTTRLKPFIEYLRRGTRVEQIPNARALRVTFTGGDPVLVAQIVKGIADVFIRRRFSQESSRFRDSASWLERSTSDLKAKVRDAELALANYQRKNAIFATDDIEKAKSPTLTKLKLTELHDQYMKARSEKILLRSIFDQVNKGGIKELPDVFSDPKIIELQRLLNRAKPIFAERQVKYGPENPKVIEIRDQIETLKRQLKKSESELANKFRADYRRAVQDERAAKTELNSAKSEAINESQKLIRFNILRQDVKTAREVYDDFLQKTKQANVQVAQQNNTNKIIQKAQIPDRPKGPKKRIIVIIAFLLSLLGSMALAFLLESLDETIKSIEDVEMYTRLPLLGVIPLFVPDFDSANSNSTEGMSKVREADSILGLTSANSVSVPMPSIFEGPSKVLESYLALRTSLLLSSAEKPPKTILFASSLSAEGKTTTAINLSISLAKLGLRVLIIDCDFRKPAIRQRFEISSTEGLTDYLSGNDRILEELVWDLSIPNLSLITSGHVPSTPTELLSSKKMRTMLEILKNRFDHIVIDAPPILEVADPVILSAIVDGTVLVVNSGKTNRNALQKSIRELSAIRSKILGVVLNKSDLSKDEHRYYKY